MQLLHTALAFSALLARAAAGPYLLQGTTSGAVLGHVDNANGTSAPLLKWYGVRYAASTAGANRFRPPQPVVPPRGVFNASGFGPACLQGSSVALRAGCGRAADGGAG
jgi:carboxylesterase type B